VLTSFLQCAFLLLDELLFFVRWTDFSMLEEAAKHKKDPKHFIQGTFFMTLIYSDMFGKVPAWFQSTFY